MKFHLQTRGKNTDYAFLGSAPDNRWWLDFRDVTSFEQATLIVRGGEGKWRCYISGISSGRYDRVGTKIRYTLILDGDCGPDASDLLAVVVACLGDPVSDIFGKTLTYAFDKFFDEAIIERLLGRGNDDILRESEVNKLLKGVLEGLPRSEYFKPPGASGEDSWVGSRTSTLTSNKLVDRISELLAGTLTGTAAMLNLLDVAEAKILTEKEGISAFLIDDTNGELKDSICQIKKKQKISAATAPLTLSRKILPSLLLIGSVVIVGIAIIWKMFGVE